MTYVVISLLASTLFLTALALHLRGDRHGQHGRPRRSRSATLPDRAAAARSPCCCSSCSASRRRCSRCSSGCPTATRPRRRRSPRCSPGCSPRSASTPSSAPRRCCSRPTAGRPRCCSSLAGLDDGGRRPRRHRPGRRQADPVVQHRQPHRLHGDGARRCSPSPGWPAAIFYIVHHIVVKTTLFLVGGLIEHVGGSSRAEPARRHGRARRRSLAVLFLAAGAEPRRHPAAVGLRRQVRRWSRPASTSREYADRRRQPRSSAC